MGRFDDREGDEYFDSIPSPDSPQAKEGKCYSNSSYIPISTRALTSLTDAQLSAFFLWFWGLSDQEAAKTRKICKKSYQERLKQAFKNLNLRDKLVVPPPMYDKKKIGEYSVMLSFSDTMMKKTLKAHKLSKSSIEGEFRDSSSPAIAPYRCKEKR